MSDDEQRYHYTKAMQAADLVGIAMTPEEVEKGYLARLLFHTMIPHSAQEAREWSRRNGSVEVHMQAGPKKGLPYGTYPRLVFAWICGEAYYNSKRNDLDEQEKRRLIAGDSLSDFMDQLGLLPTGGRWGSITQLREQMQRLFSTRIIAYEDRGGGEAMRQMHVADDYQLWWDPKSPDQASLWENEIVLGERFFKEITDNPYPFDMRILKAVKRSPLGIDLYTWLTYRVSYLKKTTDIPWSSLHGQFGADYSDSRHGHDAFVKAAKRELEKLQFAWPQLRYETPRGRLRLHRCAASVPKQIEPPFME